MQKEKWFKNKILYVNAVLFLVVALFAVDTFSMRGSVFIRQAIAAIGAVTGVANEGTTNYLSRFVGASGSNQIGDSIIYDDGTKVGIGTTSPATKLDVRGTRTSGTNENLLTLSDPVTGIQTAGYGTRIQGLSNGGSAVSAIGFESGSTGTNNDTQLSFYTQTAAGGLARRMVISQAGSIGIGVAVPETKLDVAGSISSSNQGRFKGWYSSGTGRAVEVGISSGTGYIYNYDRTASTYGPLNFNNAIYIAGSNDNVGVGTLVPAHKLDVIGAIKATGAIFNYGTPQYGQGMSTYVLNSNYLYPQDNGVYDMYIGVTNTKVIFRGPIQLTPIGQPASPVNGMMWMQ